MTSLAGNPRHYISHPLPPPVAQSLALPYLLRPLQ